MNDLENMRAMLTAAGVTFTERDVAMERGDKVKTEIAVIGVGKFVGDAFMHFGEDGHLVGMGSWI